MTKIGQGIIELSADGTKLKAGIEDAKRSIKGLGTATNDISKSASQSIDRYVSRLQIQSATLGKTTRETELYKLSLRGASAAQLEAANSALRLSERYATTSEIVSRLKFGAIAVGAAVAASSIGSFAAAIKELDQFNDLKDATGASVENISALDRVARETGGSFDTVSSTLVKFNKVLNDSGEEGQAAGRVLKSLGLEAQALKQIDPAEALRQTAVALSKFADDGNKARGVQVLFAKSIQEAAPFLKDLAAQTQLVGIASNKAAQDAEAFNKSIFEIKANAQDAARSIAADFLPVLNRLIAGYKEIKQLGSFDLIIKDAAKDLIGLGRITGDNGADINKILRERLRLQKDIDFSSSKGFATRNQKAELDELNRYLDLLRGKQARAALNIPGDVGDTISRKLKTSVPSLKVPDAKKSGGSGGDDSKAQLALDIEDIRKANEALIATYANAEKVIEAQRSANLLSDREYFDAKRGFLNLNNDAQEAALSKELARLQAEKLSGKDRIDNARKILDVQSKLDKVREATFSNLQVLQIGENAYFKKITDNYIAAEAAAQSFLDTLRLQQDRETEGLGQGNVTRSRNAGINQNQDRFAEQRLRLSEDLRRGAFEGRADDYQKELALINRSEAQAVQTFTDGFDRRIEKQKSWQVGASEVFKNYYDDAINTSKQVEEAFTNAFKGLEDGLVSFVKTGKLDFKSLADSIITDLIRIEVKKSVLGPLSNFISGSIGGGNGGDFDTLFASAISGGRAIGGPVGAGGLYRVNEKGPELLNVAGQQYLMMGSQSGDVTPNSASSSSQPVMVTNNFTVSGPIDRRTQEQMANMAGAAIARATRRLS